MGTSDISFLAMLYHVAEIVCQEKQRGPCATRSTSLETALLQDGFKRTSRVILKPTRWKEGAKRQVKP